MIHQGEILEKVLRSKKVNFVRLAREIGVTKPTIYNWFDTPIQPTERMEKIGKIINYDFSVDIPSMNNPYRDPLDRLRNLPEEVTYQPKEVYITVQLTGDDERLETVITKLKKLNEALKLG